MTQVPELFDPVKVLAAEARARNGEPARFLLDLAVEDLGDRLAAVSRRFASILDLGTPEGAFSAVVGAMFGDAVRIDAPLDERRFSVQAEGYDLILSGMAFHRVNDLPGLLLRLRQGLRPDGLMIAVFPGGETLRELREVLLEAELAERGAAGLRVAPQIDVRAAGALLQRAGFALPVIDSERYVVRYADMFALIRDLRAMGMSAAMLRRPGQPALTRAIAARAAALYAERFSDPDGRIRASFELIWISGWAPHESQQKPLKPGSAKMRLEDALNAAKREAE